MNGAQTLSHVAQVTDGDAMVPMMLAEPDAQQNFLYGDYDDCQVVVTEGARACSYLFSNLKQV